MILTIGRPVYNLNEMAHDATIKLIRQVIDSKVNLEEVRLAHDLEKKILQH